MTRGGAPCHGTVCAGSGWSFVTCRAALPFLPIFPGWRLLGVCGLCLPASSIFSSHNDVTLMSPHQTPTPDLDAAPWPRSLPGLCTAGVRCELLQAHPRVPLSVCALLAVFLQTATHAMSGLVSAQHRLEDTAGRSPLSAHGDVHLPRSHTATG